MQDKKEINLKYPSAQNIFINKIFFYSVSFSFDIDNIIFDSNNYKVNYYFWNMKIVIVNTKVHTININE